MFAPVGGVDALPDCYANGSGAGDVVLGVFASIVTVFIFIITFGLLFYVVVAAMLAGIGAGIVVGEFEVVGSVLPPVEPEKAVIAFVAVVGLADLRVVCAAELIAMPREILGVYWGFIKGILSCIGLRNVVDTDFNMEDVFDIRL